MTHVVAWNDGRFDLSGHWIHVGLSDDAYDAVPSDIAYLAQPGIRGVTIRNYWRAYEPTEGNYDWSTLENVANYIVQQNLNIKMRGFVQDRSFNASQPCPQYIVDQGNSLYYSKPNNVNQNVTEGWKGAIWKPEVMDRMIAVQDAMLKHFGDIMVGCNLQETSIGVTSATATSNGYTALGFQQQLIRMAQTLAEQNPTKRIVGFYNFLSGGMALLEAMMGVVSAQPWGVVVSGPDILEGDASLDGDYRSDGQRRVYDFIADLVGRAYCMNSAQYNSHDHPNSGPPFKTAIEIRDFAADRMNVSGIDWNLLKNPRTAGGVSTPDVFAMAAAEPDVHQLGYDSHVGSWADNNTITVTFNGRRGLSGTPTATLQGSLGSVPAVISKTSSTVATVTLPPNSAALLQQDERARLVVTNADADVVEIYRPIDEGGVQAPFVPRPIEVGLFGAPA